MEALIGLAEYMIVAKGNGWSVLHDGSVNNDYVSKEAAFDSAVAAASLALKEGHEVHISAPGREAGTPRLRRSFDRSVASSRSSAEAAASLHKDHPKAVFVPRPRRSRG